MTSLIALEETTVAATRPRAVKSVSHLPSLALAATVALIAVTPVAVLAHVAVSGTGADWPHLIRNVIPGSLLTTLFLLAMVAAGATSIGVTSAWLVVAYDFPLRRFFAWALVLPLAVPPYLAAYGLADFFHYSGPVQSLLRALFGFASPRDYWFPEIRSTPGAALVLSAVLFPYVYLTTRIVFLMQGRNIADVARTLGSGQTRVLFRVLLPVARPAIVAGLALVMMEAINDIGASEYLGVQTLTFSVYTTWLARGSLEGAAQIAMLMMAIVVGLILVEGWARRRQRFHAHRATQIRARPPRVRLSGWRAALASAALLMPVLVGFVVPLSAFVRYASRRLEQFVDPALHAALLSSVATSAATALLTVAAAVLLLNAIRTSGRRRVAALVRVGSLGYALPGTILALGLLLALAGIDNAIDATARKWLGVSTGLLLSGSAAAVVLACSLRFLALGESAVRSGLDKLPPHLDEAARSLGRTPFQSGRSVLLPLLKPALFTAAVLVFVDTVKELSATILLRPFGFNTLATHVYENASRGAIEDGAVAAILIILTALVPVMLLTGALSRDGDASL